MSTSASSGRFVPTRAPVPCLYSLLALVILAAAGGSAYAQAPAVPTIAASSQSATQINLSWTASTGAASYAVQMSSDGSTYFPLASGVTATSFKDTVDTTVSASSPLSAGKLYYYEVDAKGSGGTSSWSAPDEAITAVTGLMVRDGFWQNTASWTAGPDASGYNVQRGLSSSGPFTKINSSLVTTPTFTDFSASGAVKYFYRIQTKNASLSKVSAWTATKSTVTDIGVDCGNLGPRYTASGPYASDTGFNSGSATFSTTLDIANTADVPLYQNLRNAGSNSFFTYTFDQVPSGSYLLTVKFAEIGTGINVGDRLIDVTVNKVEVLDGFDILAATGGVPNSAVDEAVPITVTSGGLTVTLSQHGGSAKRPVLSAFALTPSNEVTPPGWASSAVPTDTPQTSNFGPASSISVVLPSGVEENHPGPDLSVYNSVGPSVTYERMYSSSLATAGVSAPGLSPGWTDNFSMLLTATETAPAAWNPITIIYPMGGQETIAPTVAGSTATFTHPAGAPYIMTGVPSGAKGVWASLSLTFADHTKFTFTRAGSNAPTDFYALTQITNNAPTSHNIKIVRDSSHSYRITKVNNDAPTVQHLLSFSYVGGLLNTLQDYEGRTVTYGYDSSNNLAHVSQIDNAGKDLWANGYASGTSVPILISVGKADPSQTTNGGAMSTALIETTGSVATGIQDAEGHQRLYDVDPVKGSTEVTINNSVGSSELLHFWANFNPSGGHATYGFTDAALNSDVVGYTGSPSEYIPATDTNRDGKQTSLSHDNYGNLTAFTDVARGTTTAYTFTDSSGAGTFPIGDLTKIAESSTYGGAVNLIPTIFSYSTTGLMQTKKTAMPDQVYGGVTAPTNETDYFYTPLGNIDHITEQSPYSATSGMTGTRTIQYHYPTAEALGQPDAVSVTGYPYNDTVIQTTMSTSYTYDTDGLVQTVTDGNRNTTTYTYDPHSHALATITYPITTGSVGAKDQFNYLYPGGPVESVQLYDESGSLFREVDYTYTKEGQKATVGGASAHPAEYFYDGLARLVQQIGFRSSLSDAEATNYLYDDIGNLFQEQYPLYPGGGTGNRDTTTYTYDPDQNLTAEVDGRNITKTYDRSVDPSNLVTTVTYSTGLPSATFSYDGFYRRKTMGDVTGASTYAYDDLSELTSYTKSFLTPGGAAVTGSQTLGYTHNIDGTRRFMSTPYTPTNSKQYEYYYDGVGRLLLENFGWSSGKNFNYLYDAGGRMISATSATSQTTYAYNQRDFLTRLTNQLFDPSIPGFVTASDICASSNDMNAIPMTYDAAGNRTSVSAYIKGFGSLSGATRTLNWTYDSLDELTRETSVPTSNIYGANYDNDFAYDLSGNPTSVRVPHSSGTTNFGFNLDNQITNTGFLFDGAGDATASSSPVYSGSTLSYDPEQRLTAITGGPGAGYAAGYDGDGLRGYKQVSGTIWYYLYDPDGGNGTVPVVESTASTGSPTSASINILNGFSADGWRARLPVSNTQPAIYTYDPSGNTVEERINSSSSPFAGYVCVFDAYGDLLSTLVSSGAVNGSFDPAGFGGEWGYFTDNTILGQDSTAGGGSGIMIPRIYQTLTHRYYDSYSAKFLARDPIGYGGGLNLYGYAGGNPILNFDWKGTRSAGDLSHDWSSSGRGPWIRLTEPLGAGIRTDLSLSEQAFSEGFGDAVKATGQMGARDDMGFRR